MAKLCFVAATPMTMVCFMSGMIKELEGHSLYLITDLSAQPEVEEFHARAHWIELPIRRTIRPMWDLVALVKLYLIMRRERFDLVYSQTPKAGLLAMLSAWSARVPERIHVFTGQVWATKKGLFRSMLKALDKVTAASATAVLVDSPSQMEFLVQEGVIKSQRASVIGDGSVCGVDAARFFPDQGVRTRIRAHMGLSKEDFLFLFMGRLNREKGILELVEAFETIHLEYRNTRLAIVGPDEEGVADLLRAKPGVTLLGYTNRPEDLYCAADAFCLPSHREGFGAVIIEAAACGVPSIASRIYGITDAVVDGETGLLHEAKNAKDLERCMRLVLNDRGLAVRLGEKARLRANSVFAKERVVGGYVAFVEKRLRATE